MFQVSTDLVQFAKGILKVLFQLALLRMQIGKARPDGLPIDECCKFHHGPITANKMISWARAHERHVPKEA
jgi:hypothetical protein